MEIVSLAKRVWIYVISLLFYTASGFASALPFLLIENIYIWLYILIGIGFSLAASIILNFFILIASGGYTIISFLFSVKIVGVEEQRITPKQALIRAFNASVIFFLIADLIYLISHHTERSIIDRLSDTFMVDMRR